MRKVLAILVVAGLLVLALSVPALANATDPPSLWGQGHAYDNQLLHQSDIPPGSQISGLAHAVKAGDWAAYGVYNVGQFVAAYKAELSQ